jgi:hypothetical protein
MLLNMIKLAIHSVPRSGSSWLGEIINSSEHTKYAFQPLFSYAFKSVLNETSSREGIDNFYQNIGMSDDEFVTQKSDREKKIKPIFYKKEITHVVYKEVRYHYLIENLIKKDPKQKVIGLVRDPLAVLNSWKNAPREFRGDLGWDFGKEWQFAELKNENRREEYFGFEKWKEVALLFQRLESEYPDNFLLVPYSGLLNNTREEVLKIFKFLGLKVTQQTLSFIKDSKNMARIGAYSVYKKKLKDVSYNGLPEVVINKVYKDCMALKLCELLDNE